MMEIFSNFAPLLPDARLLRWASPLCWAVVLVFLWVRLGGRFGRPVHLAVAAVVVGWALAPSTWSPSYWLGLAFQVPSGMTVLLCVAYLWRQLTRARAGDLPPTVDALGLYASSKAAWMASLGIVLGWVLLLDTFVLLPFYVYRWGFGIAALAAAVGVALAFWLARNSASQVPASNSVADKALSPGYLLSVVLLIFVLTRLPTGNVFDALIDPWLWLWLQVSLVRRLVRRRRLNRQSHHPREAATRG